MPFRAKQLRRKRDRQRLLAHVCATGNPHHDGASRTHICGRPDIQSKAVLTAEHQGIGISRRLRRGRCKLKGLHHTCPRRNGFRRMKAQVAERGLCIDSPVYSDAVFQSPFEKASMMQTMNRRSMTFTQWASNPSAIETSSARFSLSINGLKTAVYRSVQTFTHPQETISRNGVDSFHASFVRVGIDTFDRASPSRFQNSGRSACPCGSASHPGNAISLEPVAPQSSVLGMLCRGSSPQIARGISTAVLDEAQRYPR